MISALVLSLALAADDYAPPPAPPTAEGSALPTSFAMYVSLLEPAAYAGTGGIGVAPLSATVRGGIVLGGHHAILVGVSFAASFAGTAGTNGVTLTFAPTYRFHFKPLVAGGFSPYVQGEVFVGWATNSGTTGANTSTVPFGFGGGFGAEYLVIRNFGLNAGVGARFVHTDVSFGSVVGASTNTFGLYATAGFALHF